MANIAGATHLDDLLLLGFELFELLPDAILVVDQRGVIRYANRQAGRLFGLKPAILISAPVEALLPEHLRERHIGHRTKYTSSEMRMRPMGTGLDLAGRREDGTTFPVDIMLNPLKHLAEPMVLAVVRDVTDRRATEEALRQSRTMFEKFYEQSPDAIIVMDEIGRIDRVNALAEALFGLPRERMVGQPIEMLLPKRFHDRHWAHRASYMKDAKMRPMGTGLPLFAQRADGSEFPVDIMLSPIEIEQQRMVLAVVRDITERKRAEAQVKLLMSEVNHRAKNILSVVQALAHQTDATSSQEFISRFDERIHSPSASHDLLVKSEWRNVPFAELVRAQLAHFGGLLESRIVVRGPDLRITSAAAQVIGMALHELATNAAKYGALSTPGGCVEIVWSLEEDGAGGHRFTMEWIESGGPTVVTPTRRGFGWTVLCQMTNASLEADVTLEYAPTGVVWHLECPADRVREGDAARRTELAEHTVDARG
ncbi:MAG TPA: PAS domain S-box protein [Xanthobacteraceae bacterium]|nr:PAS domain S-box protein [Xanthobacteraceae bacterium]